MPSAADQVIPPAGSRGGQISSLTALRGVAAWWIVLFHFDSYLQPYIPSWFFYLISKGYLAVDLFFCLSGFVIFFNYGNLNFAAAREVGVFYLKRFAKIYPLHLLTICLYMLLVGLLMMTHRSIADERFSVSSLLFNLFLVQDWATTRELTWNIPSWSISAEFAAYLLFPAVAIMVRGTGGRLLPSLTMILVLLCFLNFFYVSVDFQIGKEISTLGVVRCLAQFSIGAVLARLYQAWPQPHLLLRPFLLALAVVLFAAGLQRFESVMIPLALAALVFVVAHGKPGWLNHGWLVFIGEISYSTYMIHYIVRDIFKLSMVHADQTPPLSIVVAALLCVFAASVPLYYLVERPAQRRLTGRAKLKEIAPSATGQVA